MLADRCREIDTAIVGGGVTGMYCAWRLMEDPSRRASSVEVFEQGTRTGGRLWSVTLGEEQAIPAELGGMFFSDAQDLVYRLCSNVLGLKRQAVTPHSDLAWLRGRRFSLRDFAEPGVLPYALSEDEQGLQGHELLLLAVRRIVPGLDTVWPLNPSASLSDTVRLLREASFDGVPLYRWGFWNLLARVISNEARMCLSDTQGTYALYSNWNAQEAVFSVLSDLTGNWFRLPDGYDQLPHALQGRAEAAGAVTHLEHRLLEVSDVATDGYRTLHFAVGDGCVQVRAKRVILTLSSGALQRLVWSISDEFQKALAASDGVAASKIFLAYENPWWEQVSSGPGHIGLGQFSASHTDLPMRQCFYLGQDEKSGQALLLGSFPDMRAVPFWAALRNEGSDEVKLSGPLPARMAAELTRQLSELHSVEVPEPLAGVFVDWDQAPYFGGWHAWRVGAEAWRVAERLRASQDDPGLHVCGETYGAWQGWVEGALTSAEALLSGPFGLAAPTWLAGSDCLAPYQFHSELSLALP
ncbi:MAG: NAD(P)/FAD-dependent oxidoreductase [Pseudomonadota bacterium]